MCGAGSCSIRFSSCHQPEPKGEALEKTVGEAWEQNAEVIRRAEELVRAAKSAQDFTQLKEAVEKFIESLDGTVEDGTGVLGDGDYCRLARDSLIRRGKPLAWISMLAHAEHCSRVHFREHFAKGAQS